MQPLSLPDVTPAQIIALVGAVLSVLVSSGLDLSESLQESILNLTTVLASLLIAGDAVVRHGRSRALQNQPKGEVASDDGRPSA